MASEPDRIRAEIEATREALTNDVDQLADRTSPKRIAQRRWDVVKDKARDVKETVMGASHDTVSGVSDKVSGAGETVSSKVSGAASAVSDTVSSAADTVKETPDTVARKTRGNPVAAGVIAFGVGLLAASLLPETEAERRLGQQAADKAGDLVEPLKDKAREMGSDLGDTVREAAGQVKETAKEAVANTTDQAKQSGRDAVQETKETMSARH